MIVISIYKYSIKTFESNNSKQRKNKRKESQIIRNQKQSTEQPSS